MGGDNGLAIQYVLGHGVGFANPVLWIMAAERLKGVGSMAVDFHGDFAWVYGLMVREDRRRRGIATALVEAAMEHAEVRQRCIGMACSIEKDNEPSQALFRKCGFRYVYQYRDGLMMFSRNL